MSPFDWRRDPWAALREMQQDLGRLLGGWARGESQWVGGSGYPPVSLFDAEDKMVVLAELPGVPMANIDLSITDDTLVIKGAKPEENVAEEQFHRRERGSGSFNRTIVLPDPAEADKVTATLARGILRIELPKSAASRPRRIDVRAEQQ